MIFVSGALLCLIATFIYVAFGTNKVYIHNAADYVATLLLLVGAGCMLFSIGSVLWRWMP